MAANAGKNYITPAVSWNIGERLEAQDPRNVAMINAQAQERSAYQATQAQREAAKLQADTARRQAELQHAAAMAPLEFEKQKYNTMLSMLFGGAPGGAGGINPADPGQTGKAYLRFPSGPFSGQLAAPSNVPGSVLNDPRVSIQPVGGGGFGGGFGGFFGGGQGGGNFGVDRTLPEFSADPFSRSNQKLAETSAQAAGNRQLATQQRQITENAAARGYSGSSPQVMAMQQNANQAARANMLSQRRDIGQQFGMGRAQLEQQRQGLLAQRRTDIDRAEAAKMSAQFGPQAQLYGQLLGKL